MSRSRTVASDPTELPDIPRAPLHSKRPGLGSAVKEVVRDDERRIRDQMVVDHLPLVRLIASAIHENLPVRVELDDLVHAGIMGLFEASAKYNPERRAAFSSYAKHRIKGAIIDSLRQLDWASRDLSRYEPEIAAKMGIEIARLSKVGTAAASAHGKNEDLSGPGSPAVPDTQSDSLEARGQLRDMLAIAMKVLPEHYQRVVLLYYTNELTMKEIGEQLGLTESRVSAIHQKALEKMAFALAQAGFHSNSLPVSF